MKNQDILQLLVFFKDYFNINVSFLVPKMRLKISSKLLRQNVTHALMVRSVVHSHDIVAHATNQNKHLQQLQKVFDKIREKGLNSNLRKCEFDKASINYGD